ncbi:C69 family dipeptidase [Psychromonas sp. CD1]|uniref:C69 family dipeptidase n=1 Tax=Psychromonas sp. CD1 TaxID=1979839 RepID=UPI000B9C2211|nr:C69 family dipeptidase [Psychromonas sp. CD1]
MKKISLLATMIASILSGNAIACTTILVGSQATTDGSYIIARNEDHSANMAKRFISHPATQGDTSIYRSVKNNFSYPNPEQGLQFTFIADSDTNNQGHGSNGFNSAGVGMTSTETVFNNDAVLKIDPYLLQDGINEDAMLNVVLPRIHSAKEGAEVLGEIIEEQGVAEGFGVAFVDKNEIWYLETGSGHQWMARKIPKDKYLVSANQGRLQTYISGNSDYLASPTLISFAKDNGLAKFNKDGSLDFHKSYSRNVDNDNYYNYPRVWTLQNLYTEGLTTKIDAGGNYPVFLTPTHKLSIEDVKEGLRNRFESTKHDPYTSANPKEKYRPIAVFRTQQSHIMQVQPKLPQAIGEVQYISWGMTSIGVYIPFYQGMTKIPDSYNLGSYDADNQSASWKFRKLQTLTMTNWNEFSPIVIKAYHQFEVETTAQQRQLEKVYLATYKKNPKKAQMMINQFEEKITDKVFVLTDKLTNELFTKLTHNTDVTYKFAGA